MRGTWYNLKKYGIFSGNELMQLFVTCGFIALAFFLNWWRNHDLNALSGTFWFLAFFAAALVFMFVHVFAQKWKAANNGYKMYYGYWIPGLLFTLLINVLSRGAIILFVPGIVDAELIKGQRIGVFRGIFKFKDMAIFSLFGPIASIIVVFILKPIYFATGSVNTSFVGLLILMTLLIALYSLIPYPYSVGLNMYRSMRFSVFWAAATILAFTLLIYFANMFAFILAFIIGLVVFIIYHVLVEKK